MRATYLVLSWMTVTSVLASGQEAPVQTDVAELKRLTPKQRERLQRLQMLSAVVQDWYAEVGNLPTKQRGELKESLRGFTVEFAKSRMRDDEYSRVCFVGAADGAGRVLLENRYWRAPPSPWQRLVRATIDAEKFKPIRSALAERQNLILQHSVNAWLGLIERLLDGAKPESREELREHLTEVYPSQVQRWSVCRRNVRRLHLSSDKHLRSVLGLSIDDLRVLGAGTTKKSLGSVSVTVKPQWSDDERDKAVADGIRAALAVVATDHALVVSVFTNRCQLTEPQKRLLEVAAKGVRTRHRPALGKRIRNEIADVETVFGLQPEFPQPYRLPVTIDRLPLRDSPIWQKAISKLELGDQILVADKAIVKRGLISQFLVQLDREIWLTNEQRPTIEKWLQSVADELEPCDTERDVAEAVSRLAKQLLASEAAGALSRNQNAVLEFLANRKR